MIRYTLPPWESNQCFTPVLSSCARKSNTCKLSETKDWNNFYEKHLTSWCFPCHALFYWRNGDAQIKDSFALLQSDWENYDFKYLFEKKKKELPEIVNLWNLWYPTFLHQVTTIGLQGQVDLSSPESFSRPRRIYTTEDCAVNGQYLLKWLLWFMELRTFDTLIPKSKTKRGQDK